MKIVIFAAEKNIFYRCVNVLSVERLWSTTGARFLDIGIVRVFSIVLRAQLASSIISFKRFYFDLLLKSLGYVATVLYLNHIISGQASQKQFTST